MNLQMLKLAVVGVAVGAAVGIGLFTFVYAKGYSYMSNDPFVCANCHVMNEQVDGWQKGSHKAVATCNDCHTPDDLFGKYSTKALNGFWHSYYFTFDNFHEPIEITGRNLRITEESCQRCHQQVTEAISVHTGEKSDASAEISCVRCHRSVGHLH